MTALYSFHDVRRRFGEREVLHIPELTLQAGRICALTGPNGAGKTTLMRIMAFLDAPSSGAVLFRGAEVTAEQRAGLRGRVVWVSQFPVLFSGTLLYNVEYPMHLKGLPRALRKKRALELLDLVGLPHLAEAPARRLSGGESQRACIARALAAGAEVLLFDEPTANVDRHARGEFMRIVRGLWDRERLSVFITTHDHELVAALCRERLSLFDGKPASAETRPVEARPLPDALFPQPARLRSDNGVCTISTRNGGSESAVCEGRVVGLGAGADGISIRVRLADGSMADVLISEAHEQEAARGLTLESRVQVVQ